MIFGWQYLFKTSQEYQDKRIKEFKDKYGPTFIKFVNYWIGVKTAKQSELLYQFLEDEDADQLDGASEITIQQPQSVKNNKVKNIIQGITSTKAQNLEGFMISFAFHV